ncbi:MAG: gluconolactonase [Verrucomicrobiales bacterium]|jgi:gluconolactonase
MTIKPPAIFALCLIPALLNAQQPNFEVTALTEPGLFSSGIEGPACDREGNLYAVSFGEDRENIGILKPGGKPELWLRLPDGSYGNGIRFDRAGMMFVADYKAHNILKIDPKTKKVTVLAHEPKMHQPNDVAIGPDDVLYASDPDWKKGDGALWRITPDGEISLLADGKGTTNGIEVSPDGKKLFVAESKQRRILAYDLKDGKIENEKVIIEFEEHGLDGMRSDVDGNLYVTRHGGGVVLKITPAGKILQTIKLPGSMPSNLCFGGEDGRTVYITEVENKQLLSFRADKPGLAWQRWQDGEKD